MKTFIIACGGTGGHLSPGIALAEELIERGHRCFLLVSQKKVDEQLCKAYPKINYIKFPGMGFPRQIFKIPLFLFLQFKSFIKSLKLLFTSRADGVVGFGGFTNVGIILAAAILKKACFLHEANQKTGKAIRLLSVFAKCVYIPIGASCDHLFTKKIKTCGFPLRKEIQKIDKNKAREQLGIPIKSKLLVITGGSQGAKIFNKWALDNLETFTHRNINVICLTGVGQKNNTITLKNEKNTIQVQFIPFAYNMNVIYSAADLVISRAGAGTIAELTKCETPSILIPYPHAADNHQLANALLFQQICGNIVIEQNEMHTLLEEVLYVLFNKEPLKTMQDNLHFINEENATEVLADSILEII